MSSVVSRTRQIPSNSGYYIALAAVTPNSFNGNESAPFLSSLGVGSTIGAYSTLRDMGKQVVSSGRVFRKVQLLRNTSSLQVGGTDGVSGADSGAGTTAYFTSYIELPGSGNFNGGVLTGTGAGQVAIVARLG